MKHYRIALIVGSLRRDSYNRRLAHAMQPLAPAELAFADVAIGDLPLYNQDDDANPSPFVNKLKHEIRIADGVLFVTAEYNRSIPGVLKNAIDHASRPYGESIWSGKPAGIIGVSVGASGTAMAQQHLRNVLATLDMPTLGQPEVFLHAQVGQDGLFDGAGALAPGICALMEVWLSRYTAWVSRNVRS